MSEPTEPHLLEVGRVTRAHGLRGDVVVAPITNRPERFTPGARLHAAGRVLTVVRARPQGPNVVVHFDGVDGRDAAEALRGALLLGEPLGAVAPDELWVHELIGAEVFDTDDVRLGRVDVVQANPAHDLLVLDDGALIPMVFVVDHDVVARRVVVDLPEGLIEATR